MDRILDRMKKSSNRRGISRRLERCSSSFAEDLSASTSSFVTRSLELPDFTIDGETDRINRSPGISGPEDLANSLGAWKASKMRYSSGIINSLQPQADVLSEVSSSGVDSVDRDDNAICSGGVAVVSRFFKEHASKTASENECDEKKNLNPNYHDDDKEVLFEKCLSTIDVVNLDRFIVTANEDAGKYFLLATVIAGTDSLLRLEDEGGKTWLFGFSYLNVSQCYEFTKGWRSYVEEKQLKAGDFVSFQRYRKDSSKLFIGCRKSDESFPSAVLNPTSPGASIKMVETREKLKEVETPFQPKLSEHSITGTDPILVIYCGDNQVSEEIYLISYIFSELCLRGFAPLRYDIKKSTVTENQKMLHISRVGIIIFSMNFAHSRECLDEFVAIVDHLKANDLVLIPVFFKVSVSDVRGLSGSFGKAFTRLGSSVQASQVLKWRAAMIELTSISGYAYKKGDEVILAKNIVRDVCLPLSSETNMKLRGTRLSLKSILSLLNRSQPSAPQIVGLWGMAGIGKTTIMRDFFRTQAERYDVCYFLPDFHLMCQTKGLSYLRDEFFSKVFGAEKVFIDTCDTKLSFTRDRFLGKKVLIILDGVNSAKDAEVLVGGFGWFSGGHTIILTSRNRQVLVQCNAKEIYETEKLSTLESLHLCRKFAIKEIRKGRMSLTSELVDYASGNPLALRVIEMSCNMPNSNLTKVWKGTKNLDKLKRIILSHSQQLTKFPRLSKAKNLEHIDLEGCTSLVKVNSSILHHDKLTFLSLKNCSRLRVMPTTVHLKCLEVLNLSGCSELENLQDFSSNLKELYLAGTAIREMPSSIGDLTRLVTLDLENCESLQHLPLGISNLKAMMTLKLSGCSNLKSLPSTRMTMEESVSINLHSAIQESSREAGEEFLPAFEYLSNTSPPSRIPSPRPSGSPVLPKSHNGIPQESWTRVTMIPFPSSILHSLASRLYALVSLFLCNAYLVDIPEDICWLASVMRLDLGGNSFSQIPKSIKEFCKLHSLRLRHCKNLKSLPELPRSLVVLNAHGCVSLKSFPTSFEQFPRHYTFSNCFNLSPKVVRKYIGKAIDSVEGMAKGILQEHINAPAFSICIPASSDHQSSVNLQAGSSTRIQLAPGMLKTLSGFVLYVVVEFWDNYSNTAGFGIKCICRKSRIDLSPRLEKNFHCWAPKEPITVRRDHMFVFGSVKMHHAEAVNHDFLSDSVTFEFHPVNSENQLLSDSCTVKRCGVYLITDAKCNTVLSAKRPSSSMDPGGLSSMEHAAPPYKRCRLKGVIEIVILSLRKRKREMSVPTVKSFSKVKRLCRSYVRTGNCAVGPSCSFDHPPWVLKHKTTSSIPSENPPMDMLGRSSYGKPSDKRVETSTETSKRLSVSESRQATAGKDAIDTEQEEE